MKQFKPFLRGPIVLFFYLSLLLASASHASAVTATLVQSARQGCVASPPVRSSEPPKPSCAQPPQGLILQRFESERVPLQSRVDHPQALVVVPPYFRVLSGGAEARFFGAGQLLTRSFPVTDGDGTPIGWAAGSKDHLRSDPGEIRAFAVALFDPFFEWEARVTTARSSVAAHPFATAAVACGFTLVGGGADVDYREPGNMLVDSRPGDDGQSWFASSKDHLRSAPSTIETFAVGLRAVAAGKPPLVTNVISQTFPRRNHPRGTIRTSSSAPFVAGGASVSRGGLGNMLVSIVPGRRGRSVRASGKDHLRVDRQRITVYGITLEGAQYVQRESELPC